MELRYDACRCGCVLMETEMHVLFECTLYGEERERWRGAVGDLKNGMDEYQIIKQSAQKYSLLFTLLHKAELLLTPYRAYRKPGAHLVF